MDLPRVFFVHLRRPESASANPDEQRDDPFFEFGSFGCTGCHKKNLLHPNNSQKIEGGRLAFVQGGTLGSRLVYLTPPVTVKRWADRCEIKWKPAEMPFRYASAPILVANDLDSDFRYVERFAKRADGRSMEGRFCSKIRSRSESIDPELAADIIRVYEKARSRPKPQDIASSYVDALPRLPPKTDRNRRATYRLFVAQLQDQFDENRREVVRTQRSADGRARQRCGSSR